MDEFFLDSGSEQLEKIYRWARARVVAPWAVFFGVLLRFAASVPPSVQLPPTVGHRASLNLLCAFVGGSGAGKGSSSKVAELAWPTEVLTLPLGSGQGIAETFTQRAGNDPSVPVIFDVPEVDTLTGLSSAQGSVLLPTLKSLAMGEQLGQANASKDARRVVAAHSYRACMSLGVQPGHAGVLFGDTTGGTPQRFLWVPVTDPDAPDAKFCDPEPLSTDLPIWQPGEDGVVEIVYSSPEIERSIHEGQLARLRGHGDALDGHAMLTRCKVAALLGIMHGRVEVTEWDWRQSAVVMAVSDRTRTHLLREEDRLRAAAIRERGKNDAIRYEGRDDYVVGSVKISVLKVLEKRGGEASFSDLNTALGKPHRRKLLVPALEELSAEGTVVAMSVTGGTRYRLTAVQGEHPVQGLSSQVDGHEQSVQDERGAEVISLQGRRPQRGRRPKVSCQQWFDRYLAELRGQGNVTVDAAAAREAGVAAGFSKNSLYVAANKRGLKGSVWSLTELNFSEREGTLAV